MLETALVKVVNAVLQTLLVQAHPHNVLYSKNKVYFMVPHQLDTYVHFGTSVRVLKMPCW